MKLTIPEERILRDDVARYARGRHGSWAKATSRKLIEKGLLEECEPLDPCCKNPWVRPTDAGKQWVRDNPNAR